MTWPQIESPSQTNDLTLSPTLSPQSCLLQRTCPYMVTFGGPVPAMVDYQGTTYVLNQGVTPAFTSPGTWGPIVVVTRGCTGALGRVSSPACL